MTIMIVVMVLLLVRVTLPLLRIAPISRRRAIRRERRSLGAQDGRHSGGERSDKWSVEVSAKVGRGISRGGADVEVGGAGGMTWTVHCDRGMWLGLGL